MARQITSLSRLLLFVTCWLSLNGHAGQAWISSGTAQGNGEFLNRQNSCYILAPRHVVDNQAPISIETTDRELFEGELHWIPETDQSTEQDIALVRVNTGKSQCKQETWNVPKVFDKLLNKIGKNLSEVNLQYVDQAGNTQNIPSFVHYYGSPNIFIIYVEPGNLTKIVASMSGSIVRIPKSGKVLGMLVEVETTTGAGIVLRSDRIDEKIRAVFLKNPTVDYLNKVNISVWDIHSFPFEGAKLTWRHGNSQSSTVKPDSDQYNSFTIPPLETEGKHVFLELYPPRSMKSQDSMRNQFHRQVEVDDLSFTQTQRRDLSLAPVITEVNWKTREQAEKLLSEAQATPNKYAKWDRFLAFMEAVNAAGTPSNHKVAVKMKGYQAMAFFHACVTLNYNLCDLALNSHIELLNLSNNDRGLLRTHNRSKREILMNIESILMHMNKKALSYLAKDQEVGQDKFQDLFNNNAASPSSTKYGLLGNHRELFEYSVAYNYAHSTTTICMNGKESFCNHALELWDHVTKIRPDLKRTIKNYRKYINNKLEIDIGIGELTDYSKSRMNSRLSQLKRLHDELFSQASHARFQIHFRLLQQRYRKFKSLLNYSKRDIDLVPKVVSIAQKIQCTCEKNENLCQKHFLHNDGTDVWTDDLIYLRTLHGVDVTCKTDGS